MPLSHAQRHIVALARTLLESLENDTPVSGAVRSEVSQLVASAPPHNCNHGPTGQNFFPDVQLVIEYNLEADKKLWPTWNETVELRRSATYALYPKETPLQWGRRMEAWFNTDVSGEMEPWGHALWNVRRDRHRRLQELAEVEAQRPRKYVYIRYNGALERWEYWAFNPLYWAPVPDPADRGAVFSKRYNLKDVTIAVEKYFVGLPVMVVEYAETELEPTAPGE